MPGTTQYPELVDNNVELTDGVDIIEADNVNDAYAALDAIETFMGASGAPQTKNTDVMAFLESVLPDMRIVWKDVNTVTVKAGRIYCKKSDGAIRVLRRNIEDVDVTFADIDTGARAVSTTYYVWAIADASATTVSFKISASSSAPTGGTLVALVGGFATNATGAGEIIQSSVWSHGNGAVVQMENYSRADRVTCAATIPSDDSIPTFAEGSLVLTLVITPKSATNILRIDINLIAQGGVVAFTAALFKDASGTDAAIAGATAEITNGYSGNLSFTHWMVAGGIAPITFKVRLGNSSGTTYLNGNGTARKLGGVCFSSITVTEKKV
jgi:hypothetical protein